MLFIVLFEDNPEKTSMRSQHMSAHLEFLEKNGKSILGAGPLKDVNNDIPAYIAMGAGLCKW